MTVVATEQTKTVLIVDDSRVSRMIARQYILQLQPGWNVVEAGTGEESLDQARATLPDLVLMDVNMPGMGGIAAAAQLRRLSSTLPISLLAANVPVAIRERAEALGLSFMEKPVTEARIAQLLALAGG